MSSAEWTFVGLWAAGCFLAAFIPRVYQSRKLKRLKEQVAAAAAEELARKLQLVDDACAVSNAVGNVPPGCVRKVCAYGTEFAVMHYEDLELVARRAGMRLSGATNQPFVWRPNP